MQLPILDKVCEFFSITKLVTNDNIDDFNADSLDKRIPLWFSAIKEGAKLNQDSLSAKQYVTSDINLTDMRREIRDYILHETDVENRRLRAYQMLGDLALCVSFPDVVPESTMAIDFIGIGTHIFPYWHFPDFMELRQSGKYKFNDYQTLLFLSGYYLRQALFNFVMAFNECNLSGFAFADSEHEAMNIGFAPLVSVEEHVKAEREKKPTAPFRQLINTTVCSDIEGLMNRLHELVDGKRGQQVAAVFSKLKKDGLLLTYPSRPILEAEFKLGGSYEGARKYFVKDARDYDNAAFLGRTPELALKFDFSEFIKK